MNLHDDMTKNAIRCEAGSADAEALKACPFCGVVGLDFNEGNTFRWLAYSCSGCGIGNETRVQTMGEGTNAEWQAQAKFDSVAAWNKRAGTLVGLSPQLGADDRGCATLEWWNGERKLTLYTVSVPHEALLKSWGPNMHSDMEFVSVLDATAVREAFQWLANGPEPEFL